MKGFKGLLLFFVLLLIVLPMLSCDSFEEGTIVGKRYEPEREWVQLFQVPVTEDGSVGILILLLIPMYCYDDEDWVLTVKSSVDGKIVKQDVYTTEEEYSQFNIGDLYVFGDEIEKREATDEEIERFGVLPADEDM